MKCLICKKEIKDKWGSSHPHRKRKYCSLTCFGKSDRFNGGKTHFNYKGDYAGYSAKHKDIFTHKGKATVCIVCSFNGNCHWANLDRKYSRNLNDYVSLCPSCHKRWDLGNLPINLFEWKEFLVTSS